jgi:hypothetical protein
MSSVEGKEKKRKKYNLNCPTLATGFPHTVTSSITDHTGISILTRSTSFSLASLGRSSGIGGGQAALESTVSADNASVDSPVMAGLNQLPVAADGVHGRKRNVTMAGIDSSPGSMEDMDDHDAREEKRRQPVKRACNECRQQKV